MNQQGLFDVSVHFRPLDSRAKAREKVKPTKKAIHARIVASLYLRGKCNPDAWAEAHHLSFMYARPRFSELLKAGLLFKVGEGRSVFGNGQNVYDLRFVVRDRISAIRASGFDTDRAAAQVVAEYVKK